MLCYFIGHREAPEDLYPALLTEVERHILEYGAKEFVVGGSGQFDSMAARAVKDARKRYPEVTLLRLLPYYSTERKVDIPEGIDGTFYPPGQETVPKRAAIVRANRYMVEHSEYLIAWVRHFASNAHDIVAYAQRRATRGLIHVMLL